MNRLVKCGEGPAEKHENLGEKLRRVGKRGGPATPVASSFSKTKELQLFGANPIPISARKLAASLWELRHYGDKMHRGDANPLTRPRRLNKDKAQLPPIDPSPDMLGSASSLRRHIAGSLIQYHRSKEKPNHAPASSPSYGSSMEIAPYNPAITPTSSIELKGKTGETGYSLRTSTELLKVLNHIWSLEEQHISNMSRIKSLKKELDYARSQIKTLLREQHADRHEMDELMKQITEDKLSRKNKEHDRINIALQSARDELEDERKLRKRSENLHRKLAREIYDLKTTLSSISNELEDERRSRGLLEDLCDEFALGIRDYDQELHALKQKYDKDWTERGDRDQLILHVSESWLDERMQMKLQSEKRSMVSKLGSEIEAFIEAKRNGSTRISGKRAPLHPSFRSSLESIPLNMAVSAPRDEEDDDDDSAGDDSNCFELEKMSDSVLKSPLKYETSKQKQVKKNIGSTNQIVDTEGINDPRNSQKPKESEIKESGMNTNYMIENLIRNHYLLAETGNKKPDNEYAVDSSVWRSQPSPVRQWTEKLPQHDLDAAQSSLKENTLRAKLFEARTKGQPSRSRVKL